MPRPLLLACALSLLGPAAGAQTPSGFTTGPVIKAFGPAVAIPAAEPLPEDFRLKVRFDITEAAEPGQINRKLETAARVFNMHARAGLDPEHIDLALVIHGPAVLEMTQDLYAQRNGVDNANAALIAALAEQKVRIIVCGQSAAAQGVDASDLLPQAALSLSAITAHALLDDQGYSLNPF
ncbi:MAG: DsrE family protein [Rhodothalassiaceae bacterium]